MNRPGTMNARYLKTSTSTPWCLFTVTALSFHSTGDFLLVGCDNGSLTLWDMKSHHCRTNFQRWQNADAGHTGAVVNCHILPWTNVSLSAAEDGCVRLWDLRTVCTSEFPFERTHACDNQTLQEANQLILQQNAPIKNAKVAANVRKQ